LQNAPTHHARATKKPRPIGAPLINGITEGANAANKLGEHTLGYVDPKGLVEGPNQTIPATGNVPPRARPQCGLDMVGNNIEPYPLGTFPRGVLGVVDVQKHPMYYDAKSHRRELAGDALS